VETGFRLEIAPQPDNTTCGPTCLHAVYRYFGDGIPLERVVAEVGRLPTGGTLAVLLACHALRRGYRATIYSYNLRVFDPTWFRPGVNLPAKLREQADAKRDNGRLQRATQAYLEFFDLGGRLKFKDLTPRLFRSHLKRNIPVLTGLSATYLYGCAREENDAYDDVRGTPSGHFVVLHGYDRETKTVSVADPLHDNPTTRGRYYRVRIQRILNAILLGVLTYDSNFLVIRPRERARTSAA
jgi:hypothetical protein